MRSLSRKPAIAAGMVAATSSQASRRSGSARNERSRMVAKPGRHEAQPVGPEVDEQRRSVPMWSITLNASDVMNGSVQPNRYGTMIRCPDEEIGRNSVSPCTIPMISAWM